MPEGEGAALQTTDVGRFRTLQELGRGGMATVYEVEDTTSGQRLALKRLEHESPGDADFLAQLFEREFYNLAHFAHPCVVQVHDFGHDALGRPYYTMELLDGGDLRKLSPLPFQRVCELLVDVCSVLSFLHSRRLVHRDVTPRNIRCTRDGKAKLIDFGTLTVVGPMKRLVGTPAFCAPEMLGGEDLDQRADLFALGATAYMTLTGQHAYPARAFAELRERWLTPIPPPSAFAKSVPEALDRLVMSLLQLDRGARPSSAAEVMERLCAIAGLDMREQRVVQQAYLSLPTVVGRDLALRRIRELLAQRARLSGEAILVSGAAGMGRSRLLSAAVLEAKLLDLTVLRVDATDAAGGAFAGSRALLEQLFEAMPELWVGMRPEQQETLAQLAPVLAARAAANPALDRSTSRPPVTLRRVMVPAELRSRLQETLLELILSASRQRTVLLAIDDIHRLDEPSAALMALLVEHSRRARLLMIVTADSDALLHPSDSLQFVAAAAAPLELHGLSSADTHRLLGSMFGDVPNLSLLANHLHSISAGAPGVLMQLAQHLLDRGRLRYEAGAWVLPAEIAGDELPQSLTEAFASRVARLSVDSTAVIQVLASMLPERAPSQEELLELSGLTSAVRLLGALDELIVADLVRSDRGHFQLAHAGLVAVVRARLDPATTRALHLRQATLFARKPGAEFLVVDQLVRANELERALEAFLPLVPEIEKRSVEDTVVELRALPSDWAEILQALVAHCDRVGRPRCERFAVQAVIVWLTAVTATAPTEDLFELLRQTHRDSGLDLYAGLSSCPEGERLGRALELAQRRYDATPETERVAPPAQAIPTLARTVVQAIGILSSGYDSLLYDTAPSLGPLAPLSPALELIRHNVEHTHQMIVGRHHRARPGFLALIDRLEQPDLAGFDPLHQRYIRLTLQYAIGDLELQYGKPSALHWADQIETDPLFVFNACRLRRLSALVAGDVPLADEYRHRAELLRIQHGPPQFAKRRSLVTECACYAFVEDLARLKQSLPEIEAMTKRSSGWQAVLHWAQGLYRQLRAEHEQALHEFATGLIQAPAGRHGAFLYLAAGWIETMTALGRIEKACEEGEQMLATAEANDLGPLVHRLLEALARAHALRADHDRARSLAGDAVARLEAFGARGLVMGGAYETAARVALAAGADEEFSLYAQRCAEQYEPERHPTLAKRVAALVLAAERPGQPRAPEPSSGNTLTMPVHSGTHSDLATTAQRMDRALKTQRVLRAFKLAVEATAADGGYLYALLPDGLQLYAEQGSCERPHDLDVQVSAFLRAELERGAPVTITSAAAGARAAGPRWTAADGGQHFPALLAHDGRSGRRTSGVLVLRSSDGRPVHASTDVCVTISRVLEQACGEAPAIAVR